MPDHSAPKLKPTTTTVIEPSTQVTRETQSPLNSDGPKTDKREERSSITQLLSEKLKSFIAPEEASSKLEKEANKEKEAASPSDIAVHESTLIMSEPLGFFACLREQGAKFFQIRSMKDLLSWATETITGLFHSVAHTLQFYRLSRPALQPTNLTSTNATIDSPPSTTHGFTTAPTILDPVKEFDTTSHRTVDYTAVGVAEVAEATRKAAEAKEQKAERLRAEELHQKLQVRAQILAIDARAGGENPELQAIINQLDGVYGSIEVALRNIMEAQAKELSLTRKKVA